MKKLAIAVLMLGATCSVALAQSSITLYGILDEGINFNSNAAGQRQYSMLAGVLSGNRFGFRGSEDLGSGLKAIFTLENGFDLNSGKLGQGGLMFGRQAFVGLTSNRLGTLTLGRQYDSSIDYLQPLASPGQWGGYITAAPGDPENFTAANHVNNAIKYASPDFNGLTFGGLYAPGGVAGDITQNQIYSVGAAYGNGPLRMGVAYQNIRNPNASWYATSATGATATSNNISSPATKGYASAHSEQVIDAAVNYTIGQATLGLEYANTRFKGLSGVVGALNPAGLSGTGTLNNLAATLRYLVSPSLLLAAQYDRTHGSSIKGGGGSTYNQFDLGAVYSLSKTTDFYATVVYEQASGTQSNGTPAVAAINVITASSTNRQAAVRLAIRHRF